MASEQLKRYLSKYSYNDSIEDLTLGYMFGISPDEARGIDYCDLSDEDGEYYDDIYNAIEKELYGNSVNESMESEDYIGVEARLYNIWPGDSYVAYSRELEKLGWYQGDVIFEDPEQIKQLEDLNAEVGDILLLKAVHNPQFGQGGFSNTPYANYYNPYYNDVYIMGIEKGSHNGVNESMSRFEIMQENKKNYERILGEVNKMPDSFERDVKRYLILNWIKGKNWMGGLSDSVASKYYDKIEQKWDKTSDEIYDEENKQMEHYLSDITSFK